METEKEIKDLAKINDMFYQAGVSGLKEKLLLILNKDLTAEETIKLIKEEL